MTHRFRVPDECSGLNMQYGAEYKRRGGYIEVESDSHADAIRRSWPARHGLIKEETTGFIHNDPDNDCPACGRTNWSWMQACGRCGAALKE